MQDNTRPMLDAVYGESWKWGGEPKELVLWPTIEPDAKDKFSGSAILRTVSKTALSFDNELKQLLASMTKTMVDSRGVGISAIQIGVPYRVMCIRNSRGVLYIINPKVLSVSDEKIGMKEGCLSFPNLFVNVFRPKECQVEFQNESGDLVKAEFSGMDARVFQHELDHLDGKVMLDRVGRVWYNDAIKKYRKGK